MGDYNIGKGAVLRILDAAGVLRHRVPLPREARTEISELYRTGWSLKRLGEHFGRDAQAIRRILIAEGVALRPRPGWKY